MSINVTVSGNPVRINRGKMVTSYDPNKTEFDRRRIMRLEQVREQSKNIAETLRNKLKKEKEKCLSEIEKEGEAKLKNWQNRKLLELQDQYQEALDEIGLDNYSVEDEDDLRKQREENEAKAKERGRLAAQRLQVHKNEENLKKAAPRQRRIVSTDLEVSRAHNVTKKGKKTPKKVRRKQDYDSDSENRVPPLNLEEAFDSELDSFRSPNGAVLKTVCEKEQQTSAVEIPGVSKSDKEAQTTIPVVPSSPPKLYLGLDTRISERIKRRTKLTPDLDYCSLLEKPEKGQSCTCQDCPKHKPEADPSNHQILLEQPTREFQEIAKNTKISQQSLQIDEKTEMSNPQKPDSLTQNSQPPPSQTTEIKSQKANKPEIPLKPKITLRSSKKRPVYINPAEPLRNIQFYDHPNRFTKTIPDKSQIWEVHDDEIVVSPTVLNEEEIIEKMKKRDQEAHLRGQLALEKDKIQREYRELLRKLPALQKQERILEIGTDKEKYHMSRDRLEELEKRRQNRLDNAYEELFVRIKPVTLPKRKVDPGEVPSLNLADWDTDYDDKNRSDKLTAMLSNLKSQKESLMKEIENTLSKETLQDEIKSKSTDYTRIKKRKRDERHLSPTTSDLGVSTTATTAKTKSTKSGPTPRKKAKIKAPTTKILQNTSTQTTPKSDLQSAATSPITQPVEVAAVCPCTKTSQDEMCEIVIKIKDDDKPEVQVNPPFSSKNIKVISESVDSKKSGQSWKEQLSSSSSSSSTSKSTSTSYYDPPNSSRISQKSVKNQTLDSATSSGRKQLDPRLLTYIKKLLNMTRGSIDDLTVSSASDVSTPSHSLLEAPSNNPLHQLKNVMKYFNLDAAELQKQLSYASDGSTRHYNTSESVTVTPSASGSDLEKTQYNSCSETDRDTNKLLQYAEIAKSCTEKINNLTAMIEKVRAEKKKMIETSSSGSDLATTSYKELPDKKTKEKPEDKLLKIDYNYAEHLKSLSKEDLQKEAEKQLNNDELFKSLKQLLQEPQLPTQTVIQRKQKTVVQDGSKQPIAVVTDTRTVENATDGVKIGVIEERMRATLPPECKEQPPSLFLDIPKLPRLEAPSLDKKKKRPPSSKFLKSPHELSTIVEGDSQLSAKADSPQKNKLADVPDILAEVKSSSDDVSEIDMMENMLTSIGMEWAIPTLKKTREALAMASSSSGSGGSGEVSLREFLSKISANSSKSGDGSLMSESQAGISLIQVDNRRTSTPIVSDPKSEGLRFGTESDVSSVREHSEEKFYDLNEGSTLTENRS